MNSTQPKTLPNAPAPAGAAAALGGISASGIRCEFAAHPDMTSPAADDDATLVARCARGDGAAWELLVNRYQRLVYAIVQRVGLNEHSAADVFQIVFTRLFEHLPRLAEPSRVQAWIVTTAKREALRQRQRAQRTVSITRAGAPPGAAHDGAREGAQWDMADESPIAEEALADLQQLHQVRAALEQLEPRCRELLLMLFGERDDKLSYQEVARQLHISVGSIGPTRARCLDKLRRLLE